MSLLICGRSFYLHWKMSQQISSVSKPNGLVVAAWPTGRFQMGGKEYPLPHHFSQSELGQKPRLIIGSGQPESLNVSENDPQVAQEQPKVLRLFASPLDRLTYHYGGVLFLLPWLALLARRRKASPENHPEVDRIEEGGGFDGYRLQRKLGQGATGTVWEATQGQRRCAIKILSPSVLADESFLPRFQREFEVARRFDHPNLVACHAMGSVLGTHYVVMDFFRGGCLRDILKQGRLECRQALQYAQQIAEGLHQAHQLGVVHRDLKPENILVDDSGHLALADFGLARATDSKTITVTGTVMGTPAYLSPDALKGEKAHPAADMYSFGVILFELLEGHVPFVDREIMTLFQAHLSRKPPELDGSYPDELRSLVAQLLSKEAQARPSAQEALQILTRCLQLQSSGSFQRTTS